MDKPPLSEPPAGQRARELWLNHAGGYILVRDVRDYARAQVSPGLSDEAQSAALKAIDDALYGLCMVLDGVPEPLANGRHRVSLATQVVLSERRGGDLVEAQRISEPEGWCMGYHAWVAGDFGENPPVVKAKP